MNLLDVVCFRQAGQGAARNYYSNFGDSASAHPTNGAVVANRMSLSYKLCSRRRRRVVADSDSGVNATKKVIGGAKTVLRSQRYYYTLISSSA
jgi:hypothetical protein